MEWIVDIVKEKVASYLKDKIFLWPGAIVDIPEGWALCDGTQGTPNLLSRFMPGAGSTYNPADTGGVPAHRHNFIASGLHHVLPAGLDVNFGTQYGKRTETHDLPGLTFFAPGRAPYYALAFIMKL